MNFLNSDFYKDAASYATTGVTSSTTSNANAAVAGADPKSLIDPDVHQFLNASLSSSHSINQWRSNMVRTIVCVLGCIIFVAVVYWIRAGSKHANVKVVNADVNARNNKRVVNVNTSESVMDVWADNPASNI